MNEFITDLNTAAANFDTADPRTAKPAITMFKSSKALMDAVTGRAELGQQRAAMQLWSKLHQAAAAAEKDGGS